MERISGLEMHRVRSSAIFSGQIVHSFDENRFASARIRELEFDRCAQRRIADLSSLSFLPLFCSKYLPPPPPPFQKLKFSSLSLSLENHQVEEFYVLTWEAKKEQIFEMPTGGAAIMRKGPNLLKLARKEQCMALVTTFRAKKIANGCIYRVFPSGEVQYLHPKDGVYPEKVNAGRVGANQNMRSIGKNTNPVNVKFQGQGTFDV